MARVYTSRQLFDPSLASYMEQVIQNRVANEANRNKEFLSSTRNMLSSIGETADDYIGRYQREKELQNAEANKNSVSYIDDPTYRAAREEYIRTGSSQPITSYMLQKEAAKARALEAKKAAENKSSNEAFHNAVRLAQARPEYAKTQKAMNDAIDAGDYETAEMYKKTLQAYETEFGNVFGDDAATVLEARKKTAEAKREAAAQEKADKEALELGEKNLKTLQDAAEQERLYRVEQFLSTLPTVFKKDAEKQAVYDKINANEDMNTSEKAAMLKKIRETDSTETAKKKSIQGTVASKTGEKTGKKIDASTAQKELADAAKAKKEKGFNLTSAEQEAYDAVYGGK